MKNNSGITMVSLVVTIVILFLLASISINVGTESYNMMKIQSFISKMKVIQGKVDNIAEETDDWSDYGFEKLNDKSGDDDYAFFLDVISNPENYNIDTSNSWNNTLDSDINNYYYFKKDDLEKIGLKNQDATVIINFKTRNVIALKGVKNEDDNKKYYRQYDLPGGDSLINN